MKRESQFEKYGLPERRSANKDRQESLEKLAQVRKDDSSRKQDWGYLACSIPPLDWAVIKVRLPDLMSPDAQIKNQAWAKFLNSPESLPYRVQEGRRY